MKTKILCIMISIAMCCCIEGCANSKKSSETKTTILETTTSKVDTTELEESSDDKKAEENTTNEETTSIVEETSSKIEETTTKKEVETTKKQPETTTKKTVSTTKKPTTTKKEETTTKKQEETTVKKVTLEEVVGLSKGEMDKKTTENLSNLIIYGENGEVLVTPFTTDQLKKELSKKTKEWDDIIADHVGFSYDEWDDNYDGLRLYIKNVIESFYDKNLTSVSDWVGYTDQDLRDWLTYCIYHDVRFDLNEFGLYNGGPYKDILVRYMEAKHPRIEVADMGQMYVEYIENMTINNGKNRVNYIIYFENKKTKDVYKALCNIGSDTEGCFINVYDIGLVR